jgi:hypothetical protein
LRKILPSWRTPEALLGTVCGRAQVAGKSI